MKEEDFEEKVYLQPGDIVTLKQDLPNKPMMMVVRKEMAIFKDMPGGAGLKGLRCRWFTSDGVMQEAVYSTKDLRLERRGNEKQNSKI